MDGSASCNKAHVVDETLLWYAWDEFFSQHFKPVHGISALHRLEFSSLHPGVVKVQLHSDSEHQLVPILKSSVEDLLAAGQPGAVPAGGLSNERKRRRLPLQDH